MARGYGWGPHRVYVDEAGWRTAPPATSDEAGRSYPDRSRDAAEPPLGLETAAHGGQAARFRMAVMGDSFVEAVQVAWEDTFVARMQARSAGRTEVLNRANSSYSPLIALLRWQRQVAHERPTHLLLLLCSNDLADDQRYTASAVRRDDGDGDSATARQGRAQPAGGRGPVAEAAASAQGPGAAHLVWRRPPPRSSQHDQGRLYRTYRLWRGRAVRVRSRLLDWRDPERLVRRGRNQNRELTDLTGGYLLDLAAHAREAGVDFTVSAVPRVEEFRDRAERTPEIRIETTFADHVAAWAAANRIRYVDLQPAFREAAAKGQRLFIERDGHFTPAGHAVTAEVFADAYPALFAGGGASTAQRSGE